MDNLYPVKQVVEAGWLPDKQYQWPAKEVYRFTTTSGKEVVQFLIFNKKEDCYELRSWNKIYLEVR